MAIFNGRRVAPHRDPEKPNRVPDTIGGAEKIMKVKNAIDLLTNYVKSLPEGEIRQAIRLVIRETKSFQTVKNRDDKSQKNNH